MTVFGGENVNTMEFVRAKKNQKAKDFADFILKECETRDFSIVDVKDLAALIPDKIGKAIMQNDERVNFKI